MQTGGAKPIHFIFSHQIAQQNLRHTAEDLKRELHNLAVSIQHFANTTIKNVSSVEDKKMHIILFDQICEALLLKICYLLENSDKPDAEAYAALLDLLRSALENFDRKLESELLLDTKLLISAEFVAYLAGMIAQHTADFTLDYFPPQPPAYITPHQRLAHR